MARNSATATSSRARTTIIGSTAPGRAGSTATATGIRTWLAGTTGVQRNPATIRCLTRTNARRLQRTMRTTRKRYFAPREALAERNDSFRFPGNAAATRAHGILAFASGDDLIVTLQP